MTPVDRVLIILNEAGIYLRLPLKEHQKDLFVQRQKREIVTKVISVATMDRTNY